ncbi:MAG TPA: hypothetical protein VIK91_04355 [Nannocystis sp.]
MRRWFAGVIGAWLVVAGANARAQEPAAEGTPAPEVEPPPTWRFKQKDRPVKVVVLAGSIGAWPKQPYAQRFAEMCRNVEVRNLSKVGFGAFQLRQRFKQQFLDNPYVNLKDPELEYWLVFQGGLNSVGTPERTNHDIRELFMLAHARGIKVVALSLTPWGDDVADAKRWAGAAGLRYLRATRKVVDFVLGALTPQEALGEFAGRRAAGADAPWQPEELPEVAVDLYRSVLRDAAAPLRDAEAMRKALAKDATWKRQHAELDADAREAALEADAAEAAEVPRWFLRAELRSFDHIHPNAEGHRLIAETACPHLPESWGCTCPQSPAAPAAEVAEAAPTATTPRLPMTTLLLLYPHWLRVLLGAPHL